MYAIEWDDGTTEKVQGIILSLWADEGRVRGRVIRMSSKRGFWVKLD